MVDKGADLQCLADRLRGLDLDHITDAADTCQPDSLSLSQESETVLVRDVQDVHPTAAQELASPEAAHPRNEGGICGSGRSRDRSHAQLVLVR